MDFLTILGGRGFVGSAYVRNYYDPAIANISSINERDDYQAHSKDVLYFVSTVHNFHVFDKPFLDIDTNLTILVKVLEDWRKRPDSKDGVFNFISSWLVYGNQDSLPVYEGYTCNPSGFYSITKRCAEQLLVDYCSTFGLKYRILRLCNVIGPGDGKVSAQKNGLQFMVNKIASGEPVEIYGTGEFYRSYIHVDDCAYAIDLVLAKGSTNEVYNIGNGRSWSFKSIIQYAHKKLNSTSEISYVEPKEFAKQVVVRSFYMNVDKLKSLGFVPKYTEEKLFDALFKVKTHENFNCSGEL
jgi:nucleoside-diphosphate-sugar epimerase